MRVNWPQFNHDGGDLAFGPDGKLYISMGDGGGADDADGQLFNRPRLPNPGCAVSVPMVGHQGDGNAQKLNVPLGKILRIDVDGRNSANGQYGIPKDNPFVKTSGALPEIWAYGFRNPFRFSFDTRTGELFVGDVGQNDIEEVNLVVKGGNHGWNVKEGTLFFHINGTAEGFASPTPDPARTIPSQLVEPIAQYDTHHEGHSVIGGFVYHGSLLRDLKRRYVFGDFALLFKFPSGPHDYGRLFVADTGGHNLKEISQLQVIPGGALSLALLGFGQDAGGEIYVARQRLGRALPGPGERTDRARPQARPRAGGRILATTRGSHAPPAPAQVRGRRALTRPAEARGGLTFHRGRPSARRTRTPLRRAGIGAGFARTDPGRGSGREGLPGGVAEHPDGALRPGQRAREVVERLFLALEQTMKDPAVAVAVDEAGMVVDYRNPAATARPIETEHGRREEDGHPPRDRQEVPRAPACPGMIRRGPA